jgi:quinohemoprotein ethanol dehydrogenase
MQMPIHRRRAALAWLGASALAVAATAVKSGTPDAEWASHGATAGEQRFSPLDQINPRTVSRLGLAWFADLGMARGEEATPIMVGRTLYISTAWSTVRAFDAQGGRLKWAFDPGVARGTLVKACCDAVNRGVAVSGGRVFVGTLDGRLIAIDARTGHRVWSVQTTDRAQPYTITGAPRVAAGLVVIGNGGAELGVRGFVTAYDARTGRKVWRFYTVPGQPGHPDHEVSDAPLARAASTWSGDAWWNMKAGGGTAWDGMAYDAKLGLIYIGTGNGSPWSRLARSEGKGDNLFLSSILAVDARTGRLRWHYQETPGDEWDYTATQNMILADLPIGGRRRQVIMQAPKNGFFYVLDRATGQLLSAEKFVPVNWAERIDPVSGRPVENPAARYSENGHDWYATPSSLGGHNWPPMAFSPRTGLVYIPAQELALDFARAEGFAKSPIGYNVGVDFAHAAQGAPPLKPAGYLLAWDPAHQREVWRAPRETFGNGGVLVQGTGTGYLKVLRADTGQELWSRWLQTGVLAPPVTYRIAGRQYIAVIAGCGGVYGSACGLVDAQGRVANLDRLAVFALDAKGTLPPRPPRQDYVLNLPDETPSPEQAEHGRVLYAHYCAPCHGYGGVSTGNQPDLRYSAMLTRETWNTVVRDGALRDAGMVSFAQVLGPEDADAIRQYVIGLGLQIKQGHGGTATVGGHGG